MSEKTGLPQASRTPEKMSACGHDGHTAILLGAAQYLAETRRFDGTVVLIFQPAEEGGAGGKAMIDDRLFDRWPIDEVYGLHNVPGLPVGQIGITHGAMLASADEFTVEVIGKGGHAAQPDKSVDPVVATGHILVALQSIASGNADPVGSLVISVCSLETDTHSHNIIPGAVSLQGTVRTLDPMIREMAEARIRALVSATAEAFGAKAELNYHRH